MMLAFTTVDLHYDTCFTIRQLCSKAKQRLLLFNQKGKRVIVSVLKINMGEQRRYIIRFTNRYKIDNDKRMNKDLKFGRRRRNAAASTTEYQSGINI